ncbi:MAG: transposase [Propionivibrio sp.]|nr:transposase [Propionivibrio sp.]
MDTNALSAPAPRRNRRHAPEFKARVIAACLQPGASFAAVALVNGLNANFLRTWVSVQRRLLANGLMRRSRL